MFLLLSDSLSDPPTLFDFIENVATVIPAKWRQVGIALGVKHGSLDGFAHQYPELQQRFEAVFHEWTNNPEQQTWEHLLKALRTKTVNENCLAEDLSQRLRR